jgi:ribosomal protein L33
MGCKECRGAVYVTWRKDRCKKECGGVLYVSMAGRKEYLQVRRRQYM